MKKRIAVLIIVIISVLAVSTGIMISVTAEKDATEFCDLVTNMLRVTLTKQDLEIDTSLPSELSENQKAQVMSDYTELLNEIYTENALSRQTYLNVMQTELSSKRTTRDIVTELGVFSTDVASFEADDETAVITVEMVYWTKYIVERESGFDILFPITKDKLEVSFKYTDGKWLISNQNLISHIFDGDLQNEKTVETYDAAIEYAAATTPINIFAE